MKITSKEKEFLLKLARQTLEEYFVAGNKLKADEKKVAKNLREKRATFVTLSKNGELRGCIGQILPKFPLYRDVVNNTLSAAFADTRFPQLKYEELKNLKIEISVLTVPKRIIYDDTEDLLKKIKAGEYGIIMQSVFSQATFLPDVWKDLPKIADFLSNLSLKAGLGPDAWKNPDCEFFYYRTESISE